MFNRKKLAELKEQNAALQAHLTALQETVNRYNMHEFDNVDAYRAHVEDQLNRNRADVESSIETMRGVLATLNEQRNTLNTEIAALQDKAVRLRETNELQDYGLFDFEHPAEQSIELAGKLDAVRTRIKQMVRNKTAAHGSQHFTFNGSAAKGKKLVNDMAKLMLRAYNAEAENCVKSVRAGNLEAAQKRLDRVADQVERLGKMMDLDINISYQRLRREELSLAAQHLQAVKAAKEAEKERRAELREQAAAERELRAERERLEKERQHYVNVLNKLRMTGTSEDVEKLEASLAEIDAGIEAVESREANIRAGYVYVISNIGSFGENMVKIGLTRRLNPLDRVRELSDASVPFNFDVHALFFSDDAVGVEAMLHRRFANQKANLINHRREFFLVSPAEVRDALKEIDGSILEFVERPEAEQYRQTQALRQSGSQGSGFGSQEVNSHGAQSEEDSV